MVHCQVASPTDKYLVLLIQVTMTQLHHHFQGQGVPEQYLEQGGLIDAAGGIITDLSAGNLAGVVGAIQKGGTAYETFKGRDLQAILKTESENIARSQIKQDLPGAARGVLFPKAPVAQSVGSKAPATLKPVTTVVAGAVPTNLTKPITIDDQTGK